MANSAAKQKKWPAWAGWLVGYAAAVLAACFLVYTWRVVFALQALPFMPFALAVVGIVTVLYLALFWAWRTCKNRPCLLATLAIVVLGLLFCFASGPMQAPDESTHFLRAYAISMGRLNYDGQRGYPDDVAALYESFPSFYNHKVQYARQEMLPAAFARYEQLRAGEAPIETTLTEPPSFMIVPLLPQALAIAVGRLFGLSALGLLYAGRMGNLLAYAALCYLVFRNANRYRGVFYAAALLPLSLFMAASNSYDGLMLALCYLCVSYLCKDEIRNKDVVVFGVALALAVSIKLPNIGLAPALLLVPKSRWKSKFNPWAAVLILLAVALLFTFGLDWLNTGPLKTGYGELGRGGGEEANPAAQMAFVAQHPLPFLSRVALTLYEEAAYLFKLGVFGWTDLPIPLVSGLSVLALCAAAALSIRQKEEERLTGALGILLMAAFYAAVVIAGLYVLESDYGSIRVTGVQPRYMLPAILLLFMLASMMLGRVLKPRLAEGGGVAAERITLCVVVAVALIAVVLLFQNGFIGQWIARPEGGYKLVNLLGWQ